ncbi:RNA-directed DNA polymerase, eukaryota, reverse transcriptase zinc-binding domain protein [Tanacetum coccineum]
MSAIKITANKFAPLQVDEEGISDEGSKTNWMRRIDKFVATRQDPPLSETGKWNEEMIQYYKDQRKRAWGNNKRDVVFKEEIELDEYDVFVDKSANAKFMSENKVRGRRSVLKSNIKFFTFIYAANHGRDRKELWQDLCIYKRLIRDVKWVIMGDMNVTLNTNEHSEGMSHFTYDMKDFQDCINEIKMEDLCSSGFQYTWTKSLKNPNATVLKKLNRVMCNNKFLNSHTNANANFLPYGISDHSPAILNCPGIVKKIHRSFRLAKEDEVKVLVEYLEATQDEEKLLCQKAKVDWLKEGDRNSQPVFTVLKGKINRSKIHRIMGADGSVFEKDLY